MRVHPRHRHPHRRRRRLPGIERLESRWLMAFGVTQTTGSSASYTIDNGGDLRFTVLRNGATTSSTIHLGDMTSVKYKNQEMLATYGVTSRHSHYEQGLSSSSTISYTINTSDPNPANHWILVKCDDSAAASGAVIQYYAVRRGDNNIYMASLPIDVHNGPGEGRYIAYLDRNVFTNPEEPSDNAGNTGAIEGSDVFGHADGTTTSKFYNVGGRRQIEHVYHGLTGNAAGVNVGAYMFMGNREHSAGGPFFKDIDFQSGSAVEIYNCIFTGHTQTETYRQGLHVYAMQFTNGAAPVEPNYAWMEGLNLQGWIPASQRGTLTGTASGIAAGHEVTVGLSNATEQYWDVADAAGNYTIAGVKAGTYTQTLYDGELEVGQKTVTIAGGATTNSNIVNTFYVPSSPIFRIGTWDGTPLGFLNSDKIEIMHPSDARLTAWTSTPNFVIGTDSDAEWPMVQFMGVNNSQRITFNLTAAQVQNLTLRIGITLGFEGGRNKVTVNAGQSYAWTSANPSASVDLNSRGITRGTWRGDNQLYTFSIPSSALRSGTNTIDLPVISGSYVAGQTWLSPNVVYDAIDLVPTSSASSPAIASVTVTPANSTVGVNGTKSFTAVARDASNNVIPANIDWSAARGTLDPNGNYIAPATTGGDTVTAAATRTRTPGYSTSSSSTSAVGGTLTGSGNTTINVLDATPTVATPASASPNPAFSGSTMLSVLGNDDGGEANLSYMWSVVGTPPSPVSFSANGNNAAKNTTATFTANGTYNFLVTITDQQNNSVTSSVSMTANDKVVWYQADVSGGATLPDSSGNSLPATLSGSYSFVPGVSGNAVRFTGGAGSLPVGVVSTLNNFTVATWVKLDTLNTWGRIFDFGTGTSAYMFLTPQAFGTNLPRFAITTSGGAGEQQVNSSVALATGTWTHLAVTLSGNTATLYINGVARGTNTGVTLRPSSLGNTTQNYLADSQFAADPALLGSLDEFRIFGRALSQPEISALAGGAVAGRVFHDVNASGAYDAGEPTVNGVQVYLDGNNNSLLDVGELSTISSGSGDYAFSNVPAGSYTVREVAPPTNFVLANAPAVIVANATAATLDLPNAQVVYTGTGSADSYLLRKNAGGKFEILIGGSLAYTVFAAAPSLTFNLGDGNDALTLDLTQGPPVPTGGVNFDAGSGSADAIGVVGTAAAESVDFAAGVLAIGGSTVTHSNTEAATFDGNHGLDTVAVSGGPSVRFADAQRLASLTLSGEARVALPVGGVTTVVTRQLTIGAGARLDLADNDLILDYPAGQQPPTTPGDYVAAGANFGAWDGLGGIITSMSDAAGGLTTLGVGDAAAALGLEGEATQEWSGQTIDASCVLIKYTYAGDANLDGFISGDDYAAIDGNVSVPGASGYFNGDFNYDGIVSGDDYAFIDSNIVAQGELL